MKTRLQHPRQTHRPTKLQRKIHSMLREFWFALTGYTHFGNYYGTQDHIHFGKGVAIGSNVVIVAANPVLGDVWARTEPKDIYLDDYCYIGSGSVVLPGVHLGSHTVVCANSVVRDSFNGYCVIAGNPAKKIKDINPEDCGEYYHGYEEEKGL